MFFTVGLLYKFEDQQQAMLATNIILLSIFNIIIML